jgi:DnaJ-class molecular chaperone
MKHSIQEQRRDLELMVRRALACPRCNGMGTLTGEPRTSSSEDNCGLCHGSGLYADESAVNHLVEVLLGDVPSERPMRIADRPA